MNPVERVIGKWKQDGVELLPPNKEPDVIAVFTKLGLKVSQDVVNLYCTIGGMEDFDSFMWSLWSLDRIDAENRTYTKPYILFADSMIDAYRYCFKYENAENSSVYVDWLNGEEPELVANSMDEFFEYYFKSPEKILI
jgi:hypothetical protein